MKRLLFLAGLFAPAVMWASTVSVELPTSQTHELVAGTAHSIPLGDGVELSVLDIGNPDASVFQLSVTRVDADGAHLTLCENQLEVSFGSEATLRFSQLGVSVRFVATAATQETTSQQAAAIEPGAGVATVAH